MSVVTFDWAPAETETKTGIPTKATENYSREEEFRLALDRYIADYAAHQRCRAEAIRSTVGTPARFAWLRQWRRSLAATREIWSFSHECAGTEDYLVGIIPHPERKWWRDSRAEAARIVERQPPPACPILRADDQMTGIDR
jgi:hypothetical protein